MLEKIKAFYKKKYSGFWGDLKATKNFLLLLGAAFCLCVGYLGALIFEISEQKLINDPDYAQRYRDFWGDPWDMRYPISILFVFIGFYCIYRMRRKYKNDEAVWPEAIVLVVVQIIMVSILLFSLYL